MVFFTMWLQLMGFSDFAASSLMAIFACGCAMGAFLGGFIGDLSDQTLSVHMDYVSISLVQITRAPTSNRLHMNLLVVLLRVHN